MAATGTAAARTPPSGTPTRELRLLGAFRARYGGRTIPMPHAVARLIAAATVVGPVDRGHAASLLWPDHDRAHGLANLRTALNRLNDIAPDFLDVTDDILATSEQVDLDLRELTTWVNQTIYNQSDQPPRTAPPPSAGSTLLPGWEESWLEEPREMIRLLQAQALETAAERLLQIGQPAEALPYALLAARAQPWSESANRLIIEIHARRGDASNALRRYRTYRAALMEELGVQPGPDMTAAVRQLYPYAQLPP